MASRAPYLAAMARLCLTQFSHSVRPTVKAIPRFLAPALEQSRQASVVRIKKANKKRLVSKDYRRPNLQKRNFPQYSLCEAMRVLRAVEVGLPPASVKYEIHINLKARRNGPVVKSSIRLPNPVQSDWEIAVVCPEDSDIARAAAAAGAVAVGEETIFEAVRQEKYTFDRLLCHEASEQALNKAGLGKILGPKGLMPSRRTKTIVTDVAKSIRDSAGATAYRERKGTIHMAIGQLGFTPDQLKANIQALLKRLKRECERLSEQVPKEVNEVILSTTNGPALSLDGRFRDPEDAVPLESLSGPM